MLPNDLPNQNNINFQNPFKNIPRLSKSIAILITLTYILCYFFPNLLTIFTLTPGLTLGHPYHFFNIITAPFVDIYFSTVFFNVMSIIILGKILEPIWGSKEYLQYIFIITFVSGIMTYITSVFFFMITLNETIMYSYFWCGFSGIISALTVAIKQIYPKKEIKLLFIIPFQCNYLPLITFIFSTLSFIFQVTPASYPFVIYGIYFGWFYLRFVQRTGETVGDLSENFRFATFFPSILHNPIDKLSSISYHLFEYCSLWEKLGSGRDLDTFNVNLPNRINDSDDAKRRRKRAAILLEKRLAQQENNMQSSSSSSSSSNINDDDTDSTSNDEETIDIIIEDE
eukprot:TRINITY_DN1619_c0_g1_i1.p1 TRINITY_DN1619_c0_g1~~TRINITY_DN1619_c0_g1_i1.p1  ORF type:complete len:341 (-),score=51.09 TRINITY_DN1619_c0_g1_i1:7-1029(-)